MIEYGLSQLASEDVKVSQTAQKPGTDAHKQVYDNVFKRLIEGQFEEIVPLLFSTLNPKIQQELTIEALLPPRRMDRVYLASTAVGKVILHIEIEMSPKGRDQTSRRILVYHSLLLEKYNKDSEKIAVITLVLYPFGSPGGKPELIETYGEEEILRFYYREMSLRTLHAPTFMQTRPIPLYGLLPVMSGVSLEVLMHAMEDMVEYYHGNDDALRDELLCFLALLNRAKPLPEEEMETILRRVRMYDPLLEEDPWVQEYGGRRKAEGKAEGIAEGETKGRTEGRAEGKAEGEIRGIRLSIEMVVQTRFPGLFDLAMERLERVRDLLTLQRILIAMTAAQNERKARHYLLALQDDK